MTSIVIAGAAGRMGQALIRSAREYPNLTIAAAFEQKGHAAVGQDAGTVAGIKPTGIRITDDPGQIAVGDVLVDFTFHTAAAAHVARAAELRRAVVLGTTGLDEAETAVVQHAAAEVPLVWAPNMSLGVNLLFALVQKAAATLGLRYTAEIDETHHVHKKDAPSGTALRLGEKVAEGRGQNFKKVMLPLEEDAPAQDSPDQIVIRSHRKGEVVGDHTVAFVSPMERIEFTHHAWTREAFAMGALPAALWVEKQRPGRIYTMQDVLGL